MILYFSGTGNSAYVAKRIASMLQDEVVDLFDRIRDQDYSPVHSDRPYVLVVPTYAWQIPHIVQDWIVKAAFRGSRDLYTVMTCGDGIGNAGKKVHQLCQEQRFIYKGVMPVIMPENYIALYKAPGYDEARQIISRAERTIFRAADLIEKGQDFPEPKVGLKDRIFTDMVNPYFYRFIVKAEAFKADDRCISCGRCVANCPLSNVKLQEGRPVWGSACTHCMACICHCPTGSIQYGDKTADKVRYVCPVGSDEN